MEKLAAGDRVISISPDQTITGISVPTGFTGTVISGGLGKNSSIGVEWDDECGSFHSLGGHCRDHHGYYVSRDSIELFTGYDWDDTPGDVAELFGEVFG